ncbi:type II toxin-antitoxin system VapB family antitoxin [Thauera sp.]|jgi:Arc/MetJ family transcription regulator|uniref:type II toxin-antitoxin system VapB family antitoxin n=1 Tax=Thauera sp. TaxID=1905334 RepID=UPI002A366985|nr:type II toxin-antitoxin system VapB family antitoxin [Thauera sp.]MDX9886867.1 type II toxin-antitoxin system VapB family antitoxin [Thauera sp.]
MRTPLALDDDLLAKAQALTGMTEKTQLVREALRALIQRESAKRLSLLWASNRSAGMSRGANLWTRETRLLAASSRLDMAYLPAH